MADKPRDLAVYWETLATDDGEAYYYNESTNVTTYDDPAAPRSSTAIRLPPKWAAFVADDGEPYFFNEERSETSWDVPAGSVFGAASPAAPAGGGSAKVAPGGGGGGLSRAPLSKVDDTRVYWQTFTDSDGAPYYFQEDAGTTTYEEPTEPVVVKGGARVFPILLPPGWLAAADASGEVYFADEQDNTAWDLPAAARSTEPAAAAPVGQGGAIHGGAAAPRPARRAATQAQRDAARALLTVNVVAWLARKRAGDAKAFRHRTLLFRKKADDTYLTVNPLERETVVRLLKDRAYEKVRFGERAAAT